jgi:hypothetical protein
VTGLAIPVLAVYFGTPLLIIYFWVRFGRPAMWPMLSALGLWLLQAAVVIYSIMLCISGHCRVSAVQDYLVGALVLGAFIGIGILLWLSARRSTTSPSA